VSIQQNAFQSNALQVGAQGVVQSTATITPDVGQVVVSVKLPRIADLLQPGVGQAVVNTYGNPAPEIVGKRYDARAKIITAGQAPTLQVQRVIAPGVGLAQTVEQAPSALTDNAIGPTTGLAQTGSLAPTLYLERLIQPGVGLAVTEGRVPSLQLTLPSGDATLTPSVGLVKTEGRAPTLLLDGAIGPEVGLVLTAERSPSLILERTIEPGAGTSVAQGLAPFLEVPAEATTEPEQGTLIVQGLAPTILTDDVIGRSYPGEKRRRGRYSAPPQWSSEWPVATVTTQAPPPLPSRPDPALRVGLGELAGIDLSALIKQGPIVPESTVDLAAESAARVRARRRREEELFLSILMAA